MPRDLSDLLQGTAEGPTRPLDMRSLRARARRRRVVRRGTGSVAGVAALLALALLASAVTGPDGNIDLVDDLPGPPSPPPEDSEDSEGAEGAEEGSQDSEGAEEGSAAHGAPLDVGALHGLPDEGVAVAVDDRVVLLGLDAADPVQGHVQGSIEPAPPAEPPPTQALLPLLEEGGSWVWSEPATGGLWWGLSGTPVAGSLRVLYDPDAHPDERDQLLRRGEGAPWAVDDDLVAAWPEDAPWWLTPEHRVVTWATCADGDCPHRFYDGETGQTGELDDGCWVAAAHAGGGQTRICEEGRQLRTVDADAASEIEVPTGTDGDPATVSAVFGDGLVRADHASCEVSEPFRLRDGELVSVFGDEREASPSAVALGVSADGRAVLHLNEANCDRQAERPGIYLLDADGGLELVWEVTAPPDAARMWSSAPGLIDEPSQSAEEAARDGVVAALADLPLHARAQPAALTGRADVATEEGRWMIARPGDEAMAVADGCGLGDPDGVYGLDLVCVMEYGEVLLLGDDGRRVQRAYPLPQVPPQWIEVSDDAVYCGRQGDGGLPTSMLCRIDRETGEATVRVFPHNDAASGELTELLGDFIEDSGWIVDDSGPGARFSEPAMTADGLVIEGGDGSASVDPETLELTMDP